MSLGIWLRGGRTQRAMSIEDIARVTKIQLRILERLEAGAINPGDGLPAEVFVRGFVRSYARAVGLDETETLRRYSEATTQTGAMPSAASTTARALVETMSELAPHTSSVIRVTPVQPSVLAAEPIADAVEIVESPLEVVASPVESLEPIGCARTETLVVTAEPIVTASTEIVEAVAEPVAEISTAPALEAEAPVETGAKKKKSRKGTGTAKVRGKRKAMATGTPFEASPIVAALADDVVAVAESVVEPVTVATAVDASTLTNIAEVTTAAVSASTEAIAVGVEAPEELAVGGTWSPKMPAIVAPTVPWRMAASAQRLAKASSSRVVPSLVIDDADPDLAERELEDRAASREPARRTFLPPILMDREDRSARQGGLTLAVIILLIAATLTLSYLMRRPSSSGDGVTQAETADLVDQLA
ncbi:MAG: hypothetical protein JWP01_4103 [Myxococcales bacterium]|nr:hypothetical protein [Myxococcales bacterium]